MKNWTAKILLLSNIPALIGLLFFGWEIKEGILLYWLETIVIGLFSIVKTSIATVSPDVVNWLSRYGRMLLCAYKVLITVLVAIIVGAYTAITGFAVGIMMILIDYGVNELPDDINPPEYLYSQITTHNIWIALQIICLSHAVSFLFNFILKKEYKINQDRQQTEILGRRVGAILFPVIPCIFIFAVISGAESMMPQGSAALLRKLPAVLLIISKTYFDFKSHRKEHGLNNVQKKK